MRNSEKIKPWMWREAIRHAPKSVSSSTRLLLFVISDFLDYDDIATGTFVGVKKLATQAGLSNRAVSNHLEHARLAGLIAISGMEGDDWSQRKPVVDRNGRFAVNRYYPRFPEWAQSRLTERLDDAKNHGIDNQPRERGSRGPREPREPRSRGPREPRCENRVNHDHATYTTTNIGSTDSAKGALTRVNDSKCDLEKKSVGPNPAIGRGLSEVVQSLKGTPETKRTAASINSSRMRGRPVVIRQTNPSWSAWIEHLKREDRDDLVCEARDNGCLKVPSLWPNKS